MREDMSKVIVERPRLGGHGMRRGRAPRDLETLRSFVGVKRQAKEHGGYKQLNENLAPLRRFLQAQAGRPWSKVHSEMSARIKPGNTVQEHVLSHVRDFLLIDVEKAPPSESAPCGLIHRAGRGWRNSWSAVREHQLYVDPDDGIIKRAKHRIRARGRLPRDRAPPSTGPEIRRLDAELFGVLCEGVWYSARQHRYELVAVHSETGDHVPALRVDGRDHHQWTDPVFGPVGAADSAKLKDLAKRYGENRLAGPKRQLSSRQLKAYGLENQRQEP
jgi:hypothetical protein